MINEYELGLKVRNVVEGVLGCKVRDDIALIDQFDSLGIIDMLGELEKVFDLNLGPYDGPAVKDLEGIAELTNFIVRIRG